MGRPNKIDKLGLGPRVLHLGATMSSRQVAEILRQEGYEVDDVTVLRYLKQHLREHAEATEHVKAAVQAELQREALTDVQRLEKLLRMAEEALEKAPVEERLSREWAAVLGQAREIIALRLKVAGAHEESQRVTVEVTYTDDWRSGTD